MRSSHQPLVFVESGRTDYLQAWQMQRELAAACAAGTGQDTVLLLEHDPVYTAGKRTRPEDRPTDGSPVIDVDRGGRITWHGPGQLVGYPIVKLADPIDVVAYVRLLEQVLMAACAEVGVATGRVEGRSGVWLPGSAGRPERKIAAIGVRIAKGVTMHGFALNCDPDMAAWERIVPCGITDAGTTSLTAETGRTITVGDMLPIVRAHLAAGLNGTLPVDASQLPRQDRAAGMSAAGMSAAGISWHLDPQLHS